MYVYNIRKCFQMFHLRVGIKGLHINEMFLFLHISTFRIKPKHLESVKVSHIRQGISADEMEVYIKVR